jgi:hypothetical protein
MLEISLTEFDLVSAYAAILSTLITIWEFIKWRNRYAVKLSCSPDMIFIPNTKKELFVHISCINQGTSPITITNVVGVAYENPINYFYNKLFVQWYCNNKLNN